ncbi:MAG: hypothetical protein JKY65_08400 [Planctomycetes bacterium]|nr:hypothetical protein [Planctomycetota bacterium]
MLAGGRAVTERLKARGQRATLRFHASKRELNETANLDALKRTFKALRRKPRPTTPIAGSDVPKLLPVGGSAPLPDAAPTASFLREFLGGILSGLQPAVWLSSLLLGILAAVVVFFLAWSPLIGLAALGVGGVWLLAWRVRLVNDVAKHKGGRSWPNWEQVPASFAMYLGLSLLFLPALACGIHSLGPDAHQVAAWDPTHPDSVFSKARIHLGGGGGSGRAFIGAVAEAAESYKDRVWGSQDALDAEREAQGVRLLDADTDRKRAQAEVAIEAIRELAGDTVEIDDRPWREVLETQLLGLRAWLEDPWDTPGRVLLLVALALFPMGLLVSARLQTAYTVFNPLLLVLSILRTPLTYASVVTVFLAADLLLVGVVWVVPPTATAALGASAGPGVSALVIGVVAVWACTVSGGVLGRYYRSRSEALGW